MRTFLLSLSGKFQAFFIVGGVVLCAFASASLFGLCFDEHQLVLNTTLTSSVYEVMGTVYAILLTFTLWGVWQHFTEARISVQNEVYALLDLVHMLEASTKKENALRQAALNYSKSVVKEEWPALKAGAHTRIDFHESHHSRARGIIHAVQNIVPENERENTIYAQVLSLLAHWLDARRTRILIAKGNSAKALWPLLFTGALVLFAFHGLFVANTIAIWISLLFGVSLVIGVTFYLIFSLDCPFVGSLSIDSEPFTLAISLLEKTSAQK